MLCIFVFLVYTPSSVKELGSPGKVGPALARAANAAKPCNHDGVSLRASVGRRMSEQPCSRALCGGAGVGEPLEAVPSVPGQRQQGRVLVRLHPLTAELALSCMLLTATAAALGGYGRRLLCLPPLCMRSLTMFSKGGFVFGIINIIGNFGTVFVDQVSAV